MALVIVIVVGLIWLFIRMAGQGAQNAVIRSGKTRGEIWRTRLDAWREQVVDKALEEDMTYYVCDFKNNEAVWGVVQGAYRQMPPHKQYESYFDWSTDGVLDKSKAGRAAYTKRVCLDSLDIILAQHGKLRYAVADGTIAALNSGEGQRTRLEWDRTLEFWIYIRDELRRHGVNARLLFTYTGHYDIRVTSGVNRGQTIQGSRDEYCDVDDVDKFRYRRGSLVWLPQTWVDDDLNPL